MEAWEDAGAEGKACGHNHEEGENGLACRHVICAPDRSRTCNLTTPPTKPLHVGLNRKNQPRH